MEVVGDNMEMVYTLWQERVCLGGKKDGLIEQFKCSIELLEQYKHSSIEG